jgi:hypothetical protein
MGSRLRVCSFSESHDPSTCEGKIGWNYIWMDELIDDPMSVPLFLSEVYATLKLR